MSEDKNNQSKLSIAKYSNGEKQFNEDACYTEKFSLPEGVKAKDALEKAIDITKTEYEKNKPELSENGGGTTYTNSFATRKGDTVHISSLQLGDSFTLALQVSGDDEKKAEFLEYETPEHDLYNPDELIRVIKVILNQEDNGGLSLLQLAIYDNSEHIDIKTQYLNYLKNAESEDLNNLYELHVELSNNTDADEYTKNSIYINKHSMKGFLAILLGIEANQIPDDLSEIDDNTLEKIKECDEKRKKSHEPNDNENLEDLSYILADELNEDASATKEEETKVVKNEQTEDAPTYEKEIKRKFKEQFTYQNDLRFNFAQPTRSIEPGGGGFESDPDHTTLEEKTTSIDVKSGSRVFLISCSDGITFKKDQIQKKLNDYIDAFNRGELDDYINQQLNDLQNNIEKKKNFAELKAKTKESLSKQKSLLERVKTLNEKINSCAKDKITPDLIACLIMLSDLDLKDLSTNERTRRRKLESSKIYPFCDDTTVTVQEVIEGQIVNTVVCDGHGVNYVEGLNKEDLASHKLATFSKSTFEKEVCKAISDKNKLQNQNSKILTEEEIKEELKKYTANLANVTYSFPRSLSATSSTFPKIDDIKAALITYQNELYIVPVLDDETGDWVYVKFSTSDTNEDRDILLHAEFFIPGFDENTKEISAQTKERFKKALNNEIFTKNSFEGEIEYTEEDHKLDDSDENQKKQHPPAPSSASLPPPPVTKTNPVNKETKEKEEKEEVLARLAKQADESLEAEALMQEIVKSCGLKEHEYINDSDYEAQNAKIDEFVNSFDSEQTYKLVHTSSQQNGVQVYKYIHPSIHEANKPFGQYSDEDKKHMITYIVKADGTMDIKYGDKVENAIVFTKANKGKEVGAKATLIIDKDKYRDYGDKENNTSQIIGNHKNITNDKNDKGEFVNKLEQQLLHGSENVRGT